MYWTLEAREPTLEEIMLQGEARIRAAVEAACERFDPPQIAINPAPIWMDEKSLAARRSLESLAAKQKGSFNRLALERFDDTAMSAMNAGISGSRTGQLMAGFAEGVLAVEAMRASTENCPKR